MTEQQARIDWVDYAKGISIILVVMMHSTLSTGEAMHQTGWLHEAVAFAKPFRIPAFFMVAGLFASRSINIDGREFFDRKILHFAYFYVLWLLIQFAFRSPGLIASHGLGFTIHEFLLAFIDPFGTLWFIYLLPVFFAVTRLTRSVPPAWMLVIGAALEIAPIDTQWTLIDEFASRFVFFYAGYLFGPWILKKAPAILDRLAPALAALAAWAALNLVLVHANLAELPFVSLILGFAGAAATICISVLLARMKLLDAIRYCGRYSLVIYLAFFLPMAATRIVLVKLHPISDVGTVSAIVTLTAVIVPLILFWLARGTALNFLFERPDRFRLVKQRKLEMQPAE